MMDTLATLAAYLSSDDSPDECMVISDLDGFLTGVACSPAPIPTEEWLQVAFGEKDTVPDTIVALVEAKLANIQEILASQSAPIEPVLWLAPEGHTIAMDWCEGFMEAVKLRPEKWDAFMKTDRGAELMMPILVHMFDENGNSLFGLAQEEIDDTLDAASEAIPSAVPAIYKHIRIVTRQ